MSKGLTWPIVEIFITAILGTALVLASLPAVGGSFDAALNQAVQYQSMEFSAAVNYFMGAPDGASYEFKLPDQQGECIHIYPTHVEIDINGRKVSSDFIAVDSARIAIDNPPFTTDCAKNRIVSMLKINDTVVFRIPQP